MNNITSEINNSDLCDLISTALMRHTKETKEFGWRWVPAQPITNLPFGVLRTTHFMYTHDGQDHNNIFHPSRAVTCAAIVRNKYVPEEFGFGIIDYVIFRPVRNKPQLAAHIWAMSAGLTINSAGALMEERVADVMREPCNLRFVPEHCLPDELQLDVADPDYPVQPAHIV